MMLYLPILRKLIFSVKFLIPPIRLKLITQIEQTDNVMMDSGLIYCLMIAQ